MKEKHRHGKVEPLNLLHFQKGKEGPVRACQTSSAFGGGAWDRVDCFSHLAQKEGPFSFLRRKTARALTADFLRGRKTVWESGGGGRLGELGSGDCAWGGPHREGAAIFLKKTKSRRKKTTESHHSKRKH